MSLYRIENLTKVYGEGAGKVTALNKVTATIPKGELIVILGASGSGKSTLLNMVGCMDKPSEGSIFFEDTDITRLSRGGMTQFRAENIGFVFQSYNLLPDLTALENVEFSTEMAGLPVENAKKALEVVGLADRMDHFPGGLSGGEQQRVSIARAIAKNPKVLLCDEPTGALDYQTGIMILGVLKEIHRKQGTSILFITHNQDIAKIADTVITIRSGEIVKMEHNPKPAEVSEVVW